MSPLNSVRKASFYSFLRSKRQFASQVPKFPSIVPRTPVTPASTNPSPSSPQFSRPQLMDKLTSSPAILKATSSLIQTLESKGLTISHEPTADDWARMMADEEVQAAIKEVGRRCDEEGVPMNLHVLETLKRETEQ